MLTGAGIIISTTDDDDEDSQPTTSRHPRSLQYDEEDPVTLRDRQSLINDEHPFGLPIWKPALYRKSRTVTRNAEAALHGVPSAAAGRVLLPGNVLWTLLFGWWLALASFVVAGILYVVPAGGRDYSTLIYGLGWYIFWPFGKYVEGDAEISARGDNAPKRHNDSEGEGDREGDLGSAHSGGTVRGGTSPEREHASEHTSAPSQSTIKQPRACCTCPAVGVPYCLGIVERRRAHCTAGRKRSALPPNHPAEGLRDLGAPSHTYGVHATPASKHWLGAAVFWLLLISVLAPLLLIVCLICWALVFTIPMAKHNWELIKHLFQHPTKIRFCSAPVLPTDPTALENGDVGETNGEHRAQTSGTPPRVKRARLEAGQIVPFGKKDSTVLLCTYRAMGKQYYKYTVGGVNIFFVNLMPVVFFIIFDGLFLLPLVEKRHHEGQHVDPFLRVITSQALIFVGSLASVIPLSYFIGMAVASISAQSSIGMGAVINATFGSIIEIILYAIALTQGKGRLVEGSIVGSLLAGVLLMPGASMCSSAMRRKEQKFNSKSAGVTSTMLIMAVFGILTPTLFYQTYGNVRPFFFATLPLIIELS
jgi:Ca2+:H+ antiporter